MVIAGAGMAGTKAAEALRAHGFEERVVLVGAEPLAPYERPPLSKAYLAGRSMFSEARVHGEGFYAEHDVELIEGERRVERVSLFDGTAIVADAAEDLVPAPS